MAERQALLDDAQILAQIQLGDFEATDVDDALFDFTAIQDALNASFTVTGESRLLTLVNFI